MGVKVDGIMVVAGLAVLAAGVAWWQREKVIEAVNPTNENNLANRAAVGLYQSVTDSEGAMGGDLYDWLNDEPEECFNPKIKQWELCQ